MAFEKRYMWIHTKWIVVFHLLKVKDVINWILGSEGKYFFFNCKKKAVKLGLSGIGGQLVILNEGFPYVKKILSFLADH